MTTPAAPARLPDTLNRIASLLVLTALGLSIFSALTQSLAHYWAGLPLWLATMIYFPQLRVGQRRQIGLLALVGAAGMLFAWGYSLNDAKAQQDGLTILAANQNVATMLVAVGFLKLVSMPSPPMAASPDDLTPTAHQELPQGRRALVKTLLGMHLFGAVINMSSVVIVGDRLHQKKPLAPLQVLILLRSFSLNCLWSPFYASIGIMMLFVPHSEFIPILSWGAPAAVLGLLLTVWQIVRTPNTEKLSGYPMSMESLGLPFVLALIVMGAHVLWPHISVLTLVSLVSIVATSILLFRRHGVAARDMLKQHGYTGVNQSRGEVVLFAAAALLASGVAALLQALDLQLAPAHFGLVEAGCTLFILVALAIVGMHPVTSVALAGSLLSPTTTDPNFLAITLLIGWSVGITLSPFSGIQLSLQSRYQISAKTLLAMNWRYGLGMWMGSLLLLGCYQWLR